GEQENVAHRLPVDGVPPDSSRSPSEYDAQPVDELGPAVGNGDATTDPGGSQALPSLQDSQQQALMFRPDAEVRHQLGEHAILGGALELEHHVRFREKIAERRHRRTSYPSGNRSVNRRLSFR